jgi:ubiquinone/menaquinone biosynthesis C-methylase UbiE
MADTILRTNAIPVYGFLSTIHAKRPTVKGQPRAKVLDCGAGGPVPPLALFAQQGFEAWGIDISEAHLNEARQFCKDNGVDIHLQPGDMREIPFEDDTFDYVYEHYAMCHLSKQDTARAIDEMHRVLKKEGLCFLGVISMDTEPKTGFGEEKSPGEYWGQEGGGDTLHSLFTDAEIEELLSDWEVLSKEKRIQYHNGKDEMQYAHLYFILRK